VIENGNRARKLALDAQEALAHWRPAEVVNTTAPYQVLDLFCGCGGMSAGFAAVGRVQPSFTIIGGCDINRDVAASFEANYGVRCLLQDLSTVQANRTTLLTKFPAYDPARPLVLIGCAPCQGFTSHRKKHWGRNDERNELVETFAALAAVLQPECIVMENVPELLSHRYWNHFETARDTLQNAGYEVQASIYNAASFGVPQERFRALVIGMRKPFALPDNLLPPDRFLTVRDAIGGLPPVAAGEYHPSDILHRCARHRQETIRTIRAVPKDGGSRPAGVGPKCLDEVKGFYDVYGRLRWNSPAITITHYARNPASGRYTHPEQDRGLTMREAALLQSFPNGYSFAGTFDSIFKQIGEAVPPKFSCAVAAHVLTELLSSANNSKSAVQPITTPVSNSYSSVIAGIKCSRDK
jgi:DNA (cytosine-5)-methyltransferase 1